MRDPADDLRDDGFGTTEVREFEETALSAIEGDHDADVGYGQPDLASGRAEPGVTGEPAEEADDWKQNAVGSNALDRPWVKRTRERRWKSMFGAAAAWCITLAITLFIMSTATVLLIGPPDALLKQSGWLSERPATPLFRDQGTVANAIAGNGSENPQSRMAFSGDQVRKVSTVEFSPEAAADSGF